MHETLLVITYGITIVASTMLGGYLPQVMRMTHVRMQLVLSFVGGMMLGVAVLLLLPHGFMEIHRGMVRDQAAQTSRANADVNSPTSDVVGDPSNVASRDVAESSVAQLSERPASVVGPSVDRTMLAMLVGLLFTFFMMRAFHFHQHGVEDEDVSKEHTHAHDHTHSHGHDQDWRPTRLGWLGVIFGLGLHTFMDGIALGAAVLHESQSARGMSLAPAGFGVYLAILLHKPLDALSLSTLMAAENRSWRSIQLANACFGLMCLCGALAALYWNPLANGGFWLGALLAASAGVFLCISLSDLLPEVQFHRHDRLQLSAAMLSGIGIALAVELLHQH